LSSVVPNQFSLPFTGRQPRFVYNGTCAADAWRWNLNPDSMTSASAPEAVPFGKHNWSARCGRATGTMHISIAALDSCTLPPTPQPPSPPVPPTPTPTPVPVPPSFWCGGNVTLFSDSNCTHRYSPTRASSSATQYVYGECTAGFPSPWHSKLSAFAAAGCLTRSHDGSVPSRDVGLSSSLTPQPPSDLCGADECMAVCVGTTAAACRASQQLLHFPMCSWAPTGKCTATGRGGLFAVLSCSK
jgi:hypothetical protein